MLKRSVQKKRGWFIRIVVQDLTGRKNYPFHSLKSLRSVLLKIQQEW